MLELGCGDGGNVLAIAETLPGARVTGLDSSASAVTRGRLLAAAAGIGNLELRCADLADSTAFEDLEPLDYVIAHGVYSWIPPAARRALLACCGRCLAPHGVAYISYNAYPGSYLRDMARDILAYHLREVTEPGRRLEHAHELMRTIVAVESPSPYARVLREHLQRMLEFPEALLYHDDLAPINTPVYFHEFVEHAAAHGLRFLSEAQLSDSQMADVPESVGALIAGLPEDPIVREQYLDFFSNRMFRQTLLVRSEAPVTRAIDGRHLQRTTVSSPARRVGEDFVAPDGTALSTTDPVLAAAMDELCDRWPESLAFEDLLARARRRLETDDLSPEVAGRFAQGIFDAYLGHIVVLNGCALPAGRAGAERPQAGRLARAQSAAGHAVVSTLLPDNRRLETESDRQLLPLLDGRHDRDEIAAELGWSRAEVEAMLARFAEYGLLLA